MNVSNQKYVIHTVGPMRLSARGWLWLAYVAFLLASLLAPWVLL